MYNFTLMTVKLCVSLVCISLFEVTNGLFVDFVKNLAESVNHYVTLTPYRKGVHYITVCRLLTKINKLFFSYDEFTNFFKPTLLR